MSNNENRNTALATRAQRAMTVDAEPIFDTAAFDHMARIAGMMGNSSLLPEHLRAYCTADGIPCKADTPGALVDRTSTTSNAFLIVNQARLFGGIDPFALAQSSYFVHGRLGYEGKLVQALIERRVGAMRFEYNAANPETPEFGITVTAWVPNSEPARQESVYGTVKEWATTKRDGGMNQQWKGAAGARRMLHYRGTREWARLYAPALVLGLMDDDDLDNLREDMRARQAMPVGARLAHNPLAADEGLTRTIRPGMVQEVIQQQVDAAAAGADPETGEIAPASPEQPADGGGQGEATGEASEAAAAAGDAPEAKPAVKRLPRGFPQKVEIACMKLVEAADVAALQKAWTEFAQPLTQQIIDEGLPTPSVKRLKDAYDARAANFATMAKAYLPAEDKPKGMDLHPTAEPVNDAPTAQQVEEPAPEEEGEDFSALVARLRNEVASAKTFEDTDDVLASVMGDLDLPRDVQVQVDQVMDARREAIGKAEAAAADKPAANDFPGNSSIVGNGAPPDAAEIEQMVDLWIGDMRACKTSAELKEYNDTKITPFMTGAYGKLIPSDMYDDAKHTFTTRMRLLVAKEKDQA